MKISPKIIVQVLLLTSVWAQYPTEWAVDAHDFEHTMTLTGELRINDQLQTNTSSAVAAFSGGQCRGVVEGTQVGEDVLYFLLIYANTPGDSLDFQAWDAASETVLSLDEYMIFSSGAALGTVDSPYELSGINSFTHIQAYGETYELPEDETSMHPLDILANDSYDRSLAMMVTFPTPPLHGTLYENLDQTFTYASDLNYFGPDSFQYRVSHAYGADSAWVQLNITPVDDPLTEFELLTPSNNTLFDQNANIAQNFSWEIPIDYDGDPISYSLYFLNDDALDTSYSSIVNSFQVSIEELSRDTWLDWHVVAYDGWGMTASADTFSVQVSSLVDVDQRTFLPERMSVSQNYPNPFNPITTIEYGLPEAGDVRIIIRDVSGRTIVNKLFWNRNPGWHEFSWDGTNNNGESVGAGIYFCQIQVGLNSEVRKMVLLK